MATMFLSLFKRLKKNCQDGEEAGDKQSSKAQKVKAAATVSSPTEAKKVKAKKGFRWRWWKKTKQTPLTEDVAENTNIASSDSEESVICIEINNGGDVGVQEATSETLVTKDVPDDTSLLSSDTSSPHRNDRCILFGGDAGVQTVASPNGRSVLNLESLELNGAGDNLHTDSPVSSKLVQVVPSWSQQGEDSKETARKLPEELTCLGLPNLDETCYMNAILQALLTLTPFVEEIHNQREVWASHRPSELFRSFERVQKCRLSNHKPQKKLALMEFKNIVARFHSEFADDEQKDAHEFLSCALNVLSSLGSDLSFEAQMKNLTFTCPVSAHIGFNMLGTRTCNGCGLKSREQQNFIILSLNLVPKANVSQCLEDYLGESPVDYRCDCGAKESSEIRSFSTLPNVLIIQLLRFRYGTKKTIIKRSNTMTILKKNSPVVLSKELVVVPESGITEQAKYSLVSVVSHFGSSAHSGHYVCDSVRRRKGQNDGSDRWLTFNDKKVKETTAKSVRHRRKRTAYLLFYERQE